jgi:type I restriction enzyme M protein
MTPIKELESRLWEAADELRANSHLTSAEYSTPVLGLIFLKFADFKFTEATKKFEKKGGGRRTIGKTNYQAEGVLYLPEKARYAKLLALPEQADIGKAINDAMKAIEAENEDLKDVLPKEYHKFEKSTLIEILKIFNSIPMDIEGDTFGKIYEYFLSSFAAEQGQGGGEFFTPTSIVKLIVEILEPYHGRILDPACGSGGMFVQSAHFVETHKKRAADEIMAYGFEKTAETVRLCKMNLAVHGLAGEIKQANTYYDEDPKRALGQYDFVMANPPFNVNNIDKERLKGDKRFPFGLPKVDNGNYLWMEIFYSALNSKGRAGFVMANSAADARASELELRKKLVQSGDVDVVVSIGSNFFYTVTLPCTLWFFDKNKKKSLQKDTVLFLDARNTFVQVDRAHREFSAGQLELLANIVRLYRGHEPEFTNGSEKILSTYFPKLSFQNVPGLCRRVSLKEIEAEAWSLNPGRYVGILPEDDDAEDFMERLTELTREFNSLSQEASVLQTSILKGFKDLMRGGSK